jgi:hypothetical protein
VMELHQLTQVVMLLVPQLPTSLIMESQLDGQ